jgi:hypothetical protein
VAKAKKTSAKQMETAWGLHFSAVSSAQSATNFKVYWFFFRLGVKKKKKPKIAIKNWGKQ